MFFHCFQRLVSVHMVECFFQVDLCCEDWDIPLLLPFFAAIKMLNSKTVWRDSHLIFPSVIIHGHSTSFLFEVRHAIGLNLSRC